MPRTKFQNFVFTAMMVFVMAYSIALYNIALENGALHLSMLFQPVKSMWIAYCFAVVYEWLVAKHIAVKLVFYISGHSSGHLARTIIMAVIMVTLMCSSMSLFIVLSSDYGAGSSVPREWAVLLLRNYPFALCLQLLIAGPLVRAVFQRIFRNNVTAGR